MNLDEVLSELRAACEASGGQQKLAREWDIAQSRISEVLRGKALPGEKIREKLGIRMGPVTYERTGPLTEGRIAPSDAELRRVYKLYMDQAMLMTLPMLQATPPSCTSYIWPDGCNEPNSCARNRRCGYWGCRYGDSDITAEIDAAFKTDLAATTDHWKQKEQDNG